jgi:hypothetical protein
MGYYRIAGKGGMDFAQIENHECTWPRICKITFQKPDFQVNFDRIFKKSHFNGFMAIMQTDTSNGPSVRAASSAAI